MLDVTGGIQDSLVRDDGGAKFQGNVGRASKDILADILKTKTVAKPSAKAKIGALLAGALVGGIAEKAAPGSGVAAGATIAGNVLGGMQQNAQAEADKKTGVLLKELDNKQKQTEAMQELYKTNPRAFANMPPEQFSTLLELPVAIDPMAEINAKLQDESIKRRVDFASELIKTGTTTGNPQMIIAGARAASKLLGHDLPEDFDKTVFTADRNESNKAFYKTYGIAGRNALKIAEATGTYAIEHMDVVDRDLKASPEWREKVAAIASSDAATSAYAEMEKLSNAYKADPAAFRGMTLQQMAEKAGADYILMSFLPKTVLDQLNHEEKNEIARLRRTDFLTKLAFNYMSDSFDTQFATGAERQQNLVKYLTNALAVAEGSTTSGSVSAIPDRAVVLAGEHPDWTQQQAWDAAQKEFEAAAAASAAIPQPPAPVDANAETKP